MYKTVFTIDSNTSAYIGYTNGARWNGWATPYFEMPEALKIMAQYNLHNEDSLMTYDANTDTFTVVWDTNDTEVWKGYDINTEDGIKHLYDIGAYCWIWDNAADFKKSFAEAIEEIIYECNPNECLEQLGNVPKRISEMLNDISTFRSVIEIVQEDSNYETKFAQLKEFIITKKGDKEMLQMFNTCYIVRSDENYYTVTLEREANNTNAFFRKLAHTICFADCSDEQVIFISYEGKELHYTGWKPNMLMEFADAEGNVIWAEEFPEWDH